MTHDCPLQGNPPSDSGDGRGKLASMPQISVVLPVYNGAATIVRATRSILEQSFDDLELIVVDDGSTDETLERLRSVRDPRLRVLDLPHGGVVVAANRGTEVATAPIIARMDADDVSHVRRLETQLHCLRSTGVDVVGCAVRVLDKSGRRVETMRRYEKWINEETASEEDIIALRFIELPLVNPTILARRRYFDLGFRDGDFPEDYDLMLRAVEAEMRFAKVKEMLFDWSDHQHRLTRSDARYSHTAFDRCRRAHLLRGPLRGSQCVDVWGVGNTGKPWLVWLKENAITVRHGYELNERKIGETIHGVRVRRTRDLKPPDGTPILVTVGAEGARAIIRPQLESKGYRVGGDAWFVA